MRESLGERLTQALAGLCSASERLLLENEAPWANRVPRGSRHRSSL